MGLQSTQLKLLEEIKHWRNVCVCLPSKALITIHMIKGTRNNRLNQFYSFLVFYMTLVIDKMNTCGLSNTASHECLGKKTKVVCY